MINTQINGGYLFLVSLWNNSYHSIYINTKYVVCTRYMYSVIGIILSAIYLNSLPSYYLWHFFTFDHFII